MKLIVLYGGGKTGKTTSLKIVYEVLKRMNHEETNVFEYLDTQYHYRDFLDVLVLDRQLVFDNIDKCIKNTTNFPLPKQYDRYSIDDAKTELDKNTIGSDNMTFVDDYLDTIDNIVSPKSSNDQVRVGVNLEGDYGYNHSPSLYDRLVALRAQQCDVVITACNRRTRNRPMDCVRNFINNNNATAYFIPTSGLGIPNSWFSNAARVLWVLRSII